MFSVYKILTGESLPLEYYRAASGFAPVLGQAVKITNGELAKAGGADNVEFICAGTKLSDGCYPVLRLRSDIEFFTEAVLTEANIGTKVQLSADGLGITATTGGCFKVTRISQKGTYGIFEK